MTTKKLWTAPDGEKLQELQRLDNEWFIMAKLVPVVEQTKLDFSEVDGLIDDMWPSGGNEYDVIRREYKTLIRAIVKLARQK